MTTQTASEQAVVGEAMRKRIVLEEQIKKLSQPLLSKRNALIGLGSIVALLLWFGFLFRSEIAESPIVLLYIVLAAALYVVFLFGIQIPVRALWRMKLERDLVTSKSDELQERLDENFFTNLVKINFKYIDKYYLQTQLQANKSFALAAIAAGVSLVVILVGISIPFFSPSLAQPGYIATAAGVLGEFIAAVFFYLYNRTVTKMGEYHEKLVLTQNVGLALRITEDLPPAEKTAAQVRLVECLSRDINQHLTGHSRMPPEIERGTGKERRE